MSTTKTGASELFSANAISPFGLPLDPSEIKSNILSTKYNLVSSTSYLLSDNIFEFNLPTSSNDSVSIIKLWSNLKRKNLKDNLPVIENFDIYSDSGNLVLGYLKNSNKFLTILSSHDSFIHLASNLLLNHSNFELHSLPLSIQLLNYNYNFKDNELNSSNYSKILEFSKILKLPILVSSTPLESQLFTIVSKILANLNIANIHLFNGSDYYKSNELFEDILNSNQINEISQKFETLIKSDLLLTKSSDIISLALSKLNETLLDLNLISDSNKYSVFKILNNKVESDFINLVFTTCPKKIELIKLSNVPTILINSPVPFNSIEFNKLIPAHINKLFIIQDDINYNSLKLDIKASLFFNKRFNIEIIDSSFEKSFKNIPIIDESYSFKFLLNDNSKFIELPSKLCHALSLTQDLNNIKFNSFYDNSINAGIFNADIQINSYNFDNLYDFILIEDIQLINSIDILNSIKPDGKILIINNHENVFDSSKIIDKILSIKTKKLLSSLKIDLNFIDLNNIQDVDETKGRTHSIAIQSAFYSLIFDDWDNHLILTKILQFFGSEAELLASVIADQVTNVKTNGFKSIKFDEEWIKLSKEGEEEKEEEEEEEEYSLLKETSFIPNPREEFIDETVIRIEDSLELTKKLMFKESYNTKTELRPDQPVKNFIVKVKENKRLTPNDYDRNIFHIEFDVSNTGLTYNIGEALGIHGRNNVKMVEEFIENYDSKLTGNELVEVVSKDDSTILEVRTLKQSLIENLDLFGKPPKRFYESIVEYATDKDEKKQLEDLISPTGAALFKKFQDEEFYTFADIFEIFKSVRPNIQELVQIINPLKRREYSIASSQKLHPNEIHLLIVVVDWIDNKGRKRFGQCSKYLSDLNIGDELVVSVKPSIMKLPELTTQPIIMAGLGTGLAPFKAFIEERQYQLEHGNEIGEIYLYLGSRHKKQEYLYGEYWESYMDEGILTHLGAAFSRDQKNKIYIQDKIRENLVDLQDLIINKKGNFYLCGPTWPVPDISACLQDVIQKDADDKGIKIDAAKAVEDMKEEGRYVLEVY